MSRAKTIEFCKSTNEETTPKEILDFCAGIDFELSYAVVMAFLAHGGNLTQLVKFAHENKDEYRPFLEFCKELLLAENNSKEERDKKRQNLKEWSQRTLELAQEMGDEKMVESLQQSINEL